MEKGEINGKKLKVQNEYIKHVYCKNCELCTLVHFTQIYNGKEGFCHIHIHPELCVRIDDSLILDKPDLKIKLVTEKNGDRIAHCPLCGEPIDRWKGYPNDFDFVVNDDRLKLSSIPVGKKQGKPPDYSVELVRMHLIIDDSVELVSDYYTPEEMDDNYEKALSKMLESWKRIVKKL